VVKDKKVYNFYGKIAVELRNVPCHMKSHNVTCSDTDELCLSSIRASSIDLHTPEG